jgi:hypothetical protein
MSKRNSDRRLSLATAGAGDCESAAFAADGDNARQAPTAPARNVARAFRIIESSTRKFECAERTAS